MTTILIVEDDPHISLFLKTNLARRMFTTVEASTGEEALQVIRKDVPDLLLLDLQLPDMHGLDLLQMIKEEFDSPTFPVIVISAWVDQHVKAIRDFRQVVEILQKPITATRLLESIRRAIMQI
ncbi:MAG: response regulator [Chitinophagaceae bacterium]|nr:response regulator [Anaerolineae bacterium]